MTIPTDQPSANAAIADACAAIQGALQWYEANMPSAEVTALHGLLARIAQRGEAIMGVASGTFANPLDGGDPKPTT